MIIYNVIYKYIFLIRKHITIVTGVNFGHDNGFIAFQQISDTSKLTHEHGTN